VEELIKIFQYIALLTQQLKTWYLEWHKESTDTAVWAMYGESFIEGHLCIKVSWLVTP